MNTRSLITKEFEMKNRSNILGKINIGLLFLPVFLFIPLITISQNPKTEIKAIIETNDNNNKLAITGIAKNNSEIEYELRYELSVISSSANGGNSSKNGQSGDFTLKPGAIRELSKTTISMNPRGITTIELLIYNKEDELMGKAKEVFDVQ